MAGPELLGPGHEGGGAYCVREWIDSWFGGVRGQVVPVAGAYPWQVRIPARRAGEPAGRLMAGLRRRAPGRC